MSTFCLVCNRGFNPFDFAFHLFGEEHQRLLIKLPIPIINFDLNTPPPSPFSPLYSPQFSDHSFLASSHSSINSDWISSGYESGYVSQESNTSLPIIPSSPIEYFPHLSPTPSQEFVPSSPNIVQAMHDHGESCNPELPSLNDSKEGNPSFGPDWHYFNRRFSNSDDEEPAKKRMKH